MKVRRGRSRWMWAALVMLLGALGTGCVEQIMLDAWIGELRSMDGSTETLHDFDVARQISESTIGYLEGVYRLDNDDTDMQYLLTRGWGAWAMRFALDAEEAARARGDEAHARVHRMRLHAALRRARFFARRWLVDRDDAFDTVVTEPGALREWLDDEVDDAEDATFVLWAGIAWAGEALAGDATARGGVEAGRVLLQHSRTLDPTAEHGLATLLLALDGAAHGDASSKKLAEEAARTTGGRYLAARVGTVLVEGCLGRAANAPQDLRAIADERDPLPAARLDNLVAARHARRYASHWKVLGPCPLPAALKAGASR